MTYLQKAEKFKELLWNANIARGYSGPDRLRWRNREEFSEWLGQVGGSLKENSNRRKGYLVLVVRKRYHREQPHLVAEFPMDFVDKALALGFLP